MTKQVQRRRGTAAQHTSFTGAEGEISVNTTNKSVHVHDGTTAGGVEAARADLGNVSDANLNAALSGNTLASLTITSADINGGTIDGTVIGGSTPAAISGTTGSFSGNLTVDTNTLFVDAANNRVGVGTSSPLSPLVVAEGTGQHGFEVQPGTLTYVFAYDRATADYGDLDISGQTLRFGTDNGVERMRITSTGSVGIGTSSPATTLDVVGSAQIGANAAKTKFYSDSTYSGIFNGATLGSNESVYMGAGALFFYGGGVERLRIDAAGNVGIGAAGSFSGVDIYKSGSTTSVVAARNDTSTTLMYATTSASFAGTTTNTPYGFVTNNTERMRITSTGLVGIGTSTPNASYRLEVKGALPAVFTADSTATSATYGGVSFYRPTNTVGNGNGIQFALDNASDAQVEYAYVGGLINTNTAGAVEGSLLFATSTSNNRTERMRITSTGSVGIGTSSPTAKLTAAGLTGTTIIQALGGDSNGFADVEIKSTGSVGASRLYFSDTAAQSGLIRYSHNTDSMEFTTAGTERMRITSTGAVGIGTVPFSWGANNRALQVQGAALSRNDYADATLNLSNNAYRDSTNNWFYGSSFAASLYQQGFVVPGHIWFTAPSGTAGSALTWQERMRIDASGNLLVGTTSGTGRIQVLSAAAQNGINIVVPTTDYFVSVMHNQGTTGDNTFIAFGTEASFTFRGSITYNRAGGLTAFNTTSDYRAKDIAGPISDASDAVLSLKPYMGTMKGATVERPMFVAHETQEIAPYAVTGEKDAVDGDGNPKYQQMDHSALVPLLTAALQEALTEIADLKARVAALEA